MLPDWLRAMPATAQSDLLGTEIRTLKQCPPFIDAMGTGWLMRLAADVTIEDGTFSWDWDLPSSSLEEAPRSPMGVHVSAQAVGAPFATVDQAIVKFMNPWTIQTPPGTSVLVTHPLNRSDLPFCTLSGLVDTDRFGHGLIHFPAIWTDTAYAGVLQAGTPVAQVMAVSRQQEGTLAVLSADDGTSFEETTAALSGEPGGYRKRFRAKDRDGH